MTAADTNELAPRSGARANLAWMLSGRVVHIVVAFGVGVLVSRYLGPSELGVLGVATAYAGIFAPFSGIGDLLVVRDVARHGDRSATILGSQAALSFVVSSIAYLLTVGAAVLFLGGSNRSVPLIAIISATLLLAPLKAMTYWFEATLQAKYNMIAHTVAVLAGAVARIAVVATGRGIEALAIIIAAEQFLAIAVVVAYYLRRRRGVVGRWVLDMTLARALAKESFPLVISSFAVAVYMRIDQVMLGALSTDRETGLYAAVVRLSEAPNFVAVSVAASFAPSVARLRTQPGPKYDAQVSRLMSVLAGLSLVYAIPVALLSTVIIAVVLGDKYDGAGPVLALHVLSSIFVFIGIGQSVWTVNESQQGWAMMRTVTGALLNIGLNFVLIPAYGAAGAALATLIAYSWTNWIGNLVARPTRNMFWLQLQSMDPRRITRAGLAELRTLRAR